MPPQLWRNSWLIFGWVVIFPLRYCFSVPLWLQLLVGDFNRSVNVHPWLSNPSSSITRNLRMMRAVSQEISASSQIPGCSKECKPFRFVYAHALCCLLVACTHILKDRFYKHATPRPKERRLDNYLCPGKRNLTNILPTWRLSHALTSQSKGFIYGVLSLRGISVEQHTYTTKASTFGIWSGSEQKETLYHVFNIYMYVYINIYNILYI